MKVEKKKGVVSVGKKLPHKANDTVVLELGGEEGVGSFVFRSRAMRDVYQLATQVAGSDASILVYGESGTGKELFARLVHRLSDRRNRPFVPVNCGVLRGELFADKFFGHEPGAFTGAQRQRKGSFELAEDGTLFLDEVGEIPPPNQVDFLRVLEEKNFKRLGGERDLPFGARIVAATNRLLPDMVARGEFRADLFYRLNVVPVSLPPLRERTDDIADLAEYFLAVFRHRYHKHGLRLDPDTVRALAAYPWPGNVRELRNVIERAMIIAKERLIRPEDLPERVRQRETEFGTPSAAVTVPRTGNLRRILSETERQVIQDALHRAGGNKTKAAKMLGIHRTSLYEKMRQHGMEPDAEVDFSL